MFATSCVTSGVPILFVVNTEIPNERMFEKRIPIWQTELCWLSWYVVRQHIRLDHERDVCVGQAQFTCGP